MLAEVQPVPPAMVIVGLDFRPVYCEGLTIEPRVTGEKCQLSGLGLSGCWDTDAAG